jgi:hypothetical protein
MSHYCKRDELPSNESSAANDISITKRATIAKHISQLQERSSANYASSG